MGRSKDLATGETRFANVSGDTFTGLVNITNTYSSDTTEQLRVSDNTGSKLDFFGHANGTKSIQAYADDGSTFYNLNLQPLGGYVTTPNQPAFQARGNFGWIATANQSYAEIGNWNVNNTYSHNIGSHFNTTSGRFTCPVAGRYQFNLIIYVNNSNNSYHGGRIYVNGGHYADSMILYQNGDSAYPDNTMSASYILNLSANDYVSYYHRNDIYGYHSYFSGFLIG